MTSKLYADLHVHASMKPFHHDPKWSPWKGVERESYASFCKKIPLKFLIKSATGQIKGFSKSNFDKCLKSGTRIICISIGPPERPFFRLRGFLRTIIRLFQPNREVNLGVCLSGFGPEFIQYFLKAANSDSPANYFLELGEDYEYVFDESQEAEKTFHIAESYTHLKALLEQSDKNIISILTIEGGHALGHYDAFKEFQKKKLNRYLNNPGSEKFQKYKARLEDHIIQMKSWGDGKHAPLFISFCHHFWNGLAGHARTFSGLMRTFGINQSYGLNRGFTPLGLEVRDMLLDRSNGRRILIDIKHMSWKTRREYYVYWDANHSDKDPLPILCSHTAVSGKKKLKNFEARLKKGSEKKKDFKNSWFSTWSVNLCDEDVQYIVASDGIAGIILHEDRLPGGVPRKKIKAIRKKYNGNNAEIRKQVRPIFLQCIMANIFQFVQAVPDKVTHAGKTYLKAWDHVGIGSDFDGLINHMEGYDTVEQFPDLREDILKFLKDPKLDLDGNPPFSPEEMKAMMGGLEAEEIVDRLMFGNVVVFLSKYFTEDYLEQPRIMT